MKKFKTTQFTTFASVQILKAELIVAYLWSVVDMEKEVKVTDKLLNKLQIRM